MNLRRGTFRLWVIFTALFIIATAALSFNDIRIAFLWSHPPDVAGWRALLPVVCDQARGLAGNDYSSSDGLCWYESPKFRALYPEYHDLSEQELDKRLYAEAGRPLKEMRPWTLVAERAAIAVGGPVVVLVLGWSLFWAFSGFTRDPRKANRR
jgi:hypothetical protein